MTELDSSIKMQEEHCRKLRENVGKIDYVIYCYQREKDNALRELANIQERLDLWYYEKQNGGAK